MDARSTKTLEARELRRSRSDRTLSGVCGGLAAYFEIHPAVFRVAFVVLTLLGGAGVLIYLAAARGDAGGGAGGLLRDRHPARATSRTCCASSSSPRGTSSHVGRRSTG